MVLTMVSSSAKLTRVSPQTMAVRVGVVLAVHVDARRQFTHCSCVVLLPMATV